MRDATPAHPAVRDLSRFIRSESYHRWTQPHVQPTPEEMAQLLELCEVLYSATFEDPTLTESQRHSLDQK